MIEDKKILQLPILPLEDIVFFPNTSLPLEINNPLTILIITDAIQHQTPIALPLLNDLESNFYFSNEKNSITCAAGIPILLDQNIDHISIIIKGLFKVKLIEQTQDIPYPVFKAMQIIENDRPTNFKNFEKNVDRLYHTLQAWVADNATNEDDAHKFFTQIQTSSQVIDYIASFLIEDIEVKKQLLTNNNIESKAKLLNLLFNSSNPYKVNPLTSSIIKDFQSIERTAKIFH